MLLAHLVETVPLREACGILSLEPILNLDVEITLVLLIGSVVERALDLLALLDREDVLQVEYRLLPVSVFGVGTSGEADRFVARRKLDVEPGDQGVDEVIAAAGQVEGAAEGQIRRFALVQVKCQDAGGVRDDGLYFDGIDEGLGKSRRLQGGVVEPVNIVPDCDALGWLGGTLATVLDSHPIFSSL